MMNHIYSVLIMKFSGLLDLILDFKTPYSYIWGREDKLQGESSSSIVAKEMTSNQYY